MSKFLGKEWGPIRKLEDGSWVVVNSDKEEVSYADYDEMITAFTGMISDDNHMKPTVTKDKDTGEIKIKKNKIAAVAIAEK